MSLQNIPRDKFTYAAHPTFEAYRTVAREAAIVTKTVTLPLEITPRGFRKDRQLPVAYHQIEDSHFQIETVYGDTYPDWDSVPTSLSDPDVVRVQFAQNGGLYGFSAQKRWPEGIVQSGWRLRHEGAADPCDFQAAGLLAHGVGTLRARIIPSSRSTASDDVAPCFRVESDLIQTEELETRLIQSRAGNSYAVVVESTNQITPEEYGAVEQLLRRADEATFVEGVLRVVQDAVARPEATLRSHQEVDPPQSHRQPSPYRRELVARHLSRGLWGHLPSTAHALLMRADYIVSNIDTDDDPELYADYRLQDA